MITQIEIENFKSFKHIKLDLGHLNLFVGTNASGKSNFFDALRVLQGIGYGFTIDEMLSGRPKSANREVWGGIRGGQLLAAYRQRGLPGETDPKIHFRVRWESEDGLTLDYKLSFSPLVGHVVGESLKNGTGNNIFDLVFHEDALALTFLPVKYYVSKDNAIDLKFDCNKPVLAQITQHVECKKSHREIIQRFNDSIGNMQQIDPDPAILRNYSDPYPAKRLGDRGENFAALIKGLLDDTKKKDAYLSWLKELVPSDIQDIMILHGAIGEPMFAVKEDFINYPAPILSDGTLRFAAIAAVFFQPAMPSIVAIEEIEKCIHPTRLRILVELLKAMSRDSQVMATTHSPTVLAWLREEDYPTTFLCKRDEETGASTITPFSKVPRLAELAKQFHIDEMYIEGWMENAS